MEFAYAMYKDGMTDPGVRNRLLTASRYPTTHFLGKADSGSIGKFMQDQRAAGWEAFDELKMDGTLALFFRKSQR